MAGKTLVASAAPAGASVGIPWWGLPPERQSGVLVARLFHRLLAAVQLAAWLSLAVQLPVLIGPSGLLPAAQFFDRARANGLDFMDAPTLLWLAHGPAALWAGVGVGVLLSSISLLGRWHRACAAACAVLYLSYAVVADDFTAFQWDNMLVEVSLLAAFLPTDRASPLSHFALRMMLFKLYLESGIAKWQSHLGDWHDGSAMTFYYETAPIPTRLAALAHQLPERWHQLESWGALVLELLVPWLIWGPRGGRLIALAAFTGFQIVNTATANYGFFTYLSFALHVFLLSDADLARCSRLVRLPTRTRPAVAALPREESLWCKLGLAAGARGLLALWLGASLAGALLHFGGSRELDESLRSFHSLHRAFRGANVYHLFGHITRVRIEAQFETLSSTGWTEHDLRFKPGDPQRAPPFVAPHQPRVDFRLWFYGLSFRRGMPRYVDSLLERLCHDAPAVQALFATPLSAKPEAVRIAFYRYRFATRANAYWQRERIGALPARSCRGRGTSQ